MENNDSVCFSTERDDLPDIQMDTLGEREGEREGEDG